MSSALSYRKPSQVWCEVLCDAVQFEVIKLKVCLSSHFRAVRILPASSVLQLKPVNSLFFKVHSFMRLYKIRACPRGGVNCARFDMLNDEM